MQDTLDGSFVAMVEPYRGALRVHCYRMLGSSHDGEDIVQETLLRAWRARETLKDKGLVRPWLYRIATNACLDELKRRPPRTRSHDAHPAADPDAALPPPLDASAWIEPMPTSWLDAASADPSSRYSLKESVALAFVAALHILSPAQRAVLLLRDVVGLSADETADALGMNLGAANSALFRARTAVEEKLGGKAASDTMATATTSIDEALLARYVHAFEESNIEELVSIFHADIKARMPPFPTWLDGRAATVRFLAVRHTPDLAPRGSIRVAIVSANGQPACAFYRRSAPAEPRTLRALSVLAVRDGLISEIDHFMTPESFKAFALAPFYS